MKQFTMFQQFLMFIKQLLTPIWNAPERFEEIKPALVDELWKVAQRELDTGFYYGTPDENKQLFGARRKIPEYKFVGEVVDFDAETMVATIQPKKCYHRRRPN